MMLLALALLAAVPQQDDLAPRLWRFKAGTVWVYAMKAADKEFVSKNTVVDAGPNSVLSESQTYEGDKEVGKKITQVWMEKDGIVLLDQVAVYKVGSRKGDEWKYQVGADKMTGSHRGTETVTVPAGTYAGAVHLLHTAEGGTMESDVWMAPGVGIVKSETRIKGQKPIVIELKDFKGESTAAAPAPRPADVKIPDNEIEDRFFKAKMQVAEVYLRDGKKDKAAEVLEDLIKTYPKHSKIPDARRLLEEARKK